MNPGHNVQRAATLTGGATGAQTEVTFQLGPKAGAIVQLQLGTTGTIRVQGRLDPDAPWADLTTDITASGITAIAAACPQMRINVTANGGTLNAWLSA